MPSTTERNSSVLKMPKLSSGEELMALHLECYKIPYQREVMLIPGRKWRVDFYLRERDIAVEVEGVSNAFSRHTTISGYRADCRKYNALASIGVKVFRFTQDMVVSGEAIDTIRAALDRPCA